MQATVPQILKCFPSLHVEGKVKKPRRESLTKADFDEMPIHPPGQNFCGGAR